MAFSCETNLTNVFILAKTYLDSLSCKKVKCIFLHAMIRFFKTSFIRKPYSSLVFCYITSHFKQQMSDQLNFFLHFYFFITPPPPARCTIEKSQSHKFYWWPVYASHFSFRINSNFNIVVFCQLWQLQVWIISILISGCLTNSDFR